MYNDEQKLERAEKILKRERKGTEKHERVTAEVKALKDKIAKGKK